jgi:serine/threonine-protein kinase
MPDPITRLNAALEGRYRIESELGEGGMATVYLADDLKHERKVALKVLKPELAAVVGAERFLAEIKTTANLQHPHILPLHDSGEADGFLYYVMPYIEGESLRERLEREKQLPVDEAVRIATDVAEALHSAHEQGVIHRDIKPANILLSKGRPLVADFGIALAVSQAGGGRLTETGLSMGTPYYMSPEQASADREPTPASDVYSLGCVLYEMLVGEPPYVGSSAQAVLAKILMGDAPAATATRPSIPSNVDSAIRRALEKLPADRFRSVQDFGKALADPGFRHGEAAAAGIVPGAGPWNHISITFAALFFAATGLAAWGWLQPSPEPGVTTRAEVTGLDVDIAGGGWRLAISRDGRSIVAGHAEDGAEPALYIRSADDTGWRRLRGTEGATNPTFSPDGREVAFDVFASGRISKVPVTGGPALPVAIGYGPHWGQDNVIVYSSDGVIYRVGASGGEPEALFVSDTIRATRPHLLPNGSGVVFGAGGGRTGSQTSAIFYLDLETREVRQLLPSGNHPRYAPTGHLIYGHVDQALMGVSFDAEAGEVTGDPIILIPSLAVRGGGASQFAVSEIGTLIYAAGGLDNPDASRLLVEVDLEGLETPLPIPAAGVFNPRYSPDGNRIAFVRLSDPSDVRVYDFASGASPVFASGGADPVWSASGDYLYFTLGSGSDRDPYRRSADFGEEAEQLSDRPLSQIVRDVSPDDSIAVVEERSEGGGRDILLIRQGTDGVEFEDFLGTEWNEYNPSISPDGRWLAYTSDQGGEPRIYVHSFPVPAGQYPVSPGRGVLPLWHPDGRTLYYQNLTQFMAVDVTTEPTISVSAPRLLFDRPGYGGTGWDIHPDGSRFIIVKGTPTAPPEIYLVTNWFTELCERMGDC